MRKHSTPRTEYDYPLHVNTWFERDRQWVCLLDAQDREILQFWDDDVSSMVEDGFLDPRDWLGSMTNYALDMRLLQA